MSRSAKSGIPAEGKLRIVLSALRGEMSLSETRQGRCGLERAGWSFGAGVCLSGDRLGECAGVEFV